MGLGSYFVRPGQGWRLDKGKHVVNGPSTAHDIRQPLNIIRLATGNVRIRIVPLLDGDDARYLIEKLDRMERQVDRAAEMVDALKNSGG